MSADNEHQVTLDIPCDVQQVDETGHPWAFLDEAANPGRIIKNAIVVSGDEEDPVVARVVDVICQAGRCPGSS